MNYITYLRVSTAKQGADGLGIDAQRAAVIRYAGSNPIAAEYVEVESGRKNKRPQLTAALAACKATGATLLIAKLDRLTRNAGFLFTLMDAGVNFVAADNPDASPLTIRILAVVAQDEAERISTRTKAALEAKRAKGEKMGNPDNLTHAARLAGVEAVKANAAASLEWQRARALVSALSGIGHSLRSIAAQLNAAGFVTRNSKPFHAATVARLMA